MSNKYHSETNQDDLHYAIQNNIDALFGKFTEEDIDEIIAEVCGANDELAWWWVISLKTGAYVLLHGSCDYTGWDCQSSLHIDYMGNINALAAAKRAPEIEEYSGRTIRKNLIEQIEGKQPFALYTQ